MRRTTALQQSSPALSSSRPGHRRVDSDASLYSNPSPGTASPRHKSSSSSLRPQSARTLADIAAQSEPMPIPKRSSSHASRSPPGSPGMSPRSDMPPRVNQRASSRPHDTPTLNGSRTPSGKAADSVKSLGMGSGKQAIPTRVSSVPHSAPAALLGLGLGDSSTE